MLLFAKVWKANNPAAITSTEVIAMTIALKGLEGFALGLTEESCGSINSPLLVAVKTI